jgi:Family of unknown function (DUF5703)
MRAGPVEACPSTSSGHITLEHPQTARLEHALCWPPMTVGRIEYQVERVRLGRHLSRNAVRQLLADHAEYGGWELARLRRYRDGTRDAWIRRKIIRVRN